MSKSKQTIDPALVKTVDDWVQYSKYKNVQRITHDGISNTLVVFQPGTETVAVAIPHDYGVDFRTALSSDDARIREQAQAKYTELSAERMKNAAALQQVFAQKQSEYFDAIKEFKTTRANADEVATLGAELASVESEVRAAMYPGRYVQVIGEKQVSYRFLTNASMNDRKVPYDVRLMKNEYETSEQRIIAKGKA